MQFARSTLDNGIRLLTANVPHVRSVTICFYFGVGSRYETAELSGASHLIEHMLFKGSRRFPTARVISEAIEGVGGLLEAETGKELTVYSTKTASQHFELSLGLLADMVRYPLFVPAELDKERRVIIEELNMYRDSPQEWVGVIGEETFWPELPLGREVAGDRESVESISLDALQAYRTSHYVPGNLVVSIVGNIEHESVRASVAAQLGDWDRRPVLRFLPCPPPRETPRIRLEQRPTEQTNFCLYTLGLPTDHPDSHALVLLNTILGGGMSSRLFQSVREEQGLAYDVGSTPISYLDTGAYLVSAGVEPKQTGAALTAILREMARMRDEPVAEDELERAKEYSRGRIALSLEDTHSVASWLGGQEALLGRVRELDDTLARINAVTREDVQRVARELFDDAWLRLAIIGPHRRSTTFEQQLHL
jgi:predicted Zn-dependent peptidase